MERDQLMFPPLKGLSWTVDVNASMEVQKLWLSVALTGMSSSVCGGLPDGQSLPPDLLLTSPLRPLPLESGAETAQLGLKALINTKYILDPLHRRGKSSAYIRQCVPLTVGVPLSSAEGAALNTSGKYLRERPAWRVGRGGLWNGSPRKQYSIRLDGHLLRELVVKKGPWSGGSLTQISSCPGNGHLTY